MTIHAYPSGLFLFDLKARLPIRAQFCRPNIQFHAANPVYLGNLQRMWFVQKYTPNDLWVHLFCTDAKGQLQFLGPKQ